MNINMEQLGQKKEMVSTLPQPRIDAMKNLSHEDYTKGADLALEMMGTLDESDMDEIKKLQEELGIEV